MRTNILASLLYFGILLAFFFHIVCSINNTDSNGCPPGLNCTCGECVLNDSCDTETGYCREDCQPGYKGKGCFIKCGPDEDCVNPCSCQNSCQCDRQRLICDVECQELIQHQVVARGVRHKTAVYLSLIMAIGLIFVAAIIVWSGDQCMVTQRHVLPGVQGDGPHQGPFSSPSNPSALAAIRIVNGPPGSNDRIESGVRSLPIEEEDSRRKRHYRKDRRFSSSRPSRSIISAPYLSESENLPRSTPLAEFTALTRTGDTKNCSSWTFRSGPVGNSDLINADMEDASSSTDTTEFLTILSPLSNTRCVGMLRSTEKRDNPEESICLSGSSFTIHILQEADALQHSEAAVAGSLEQTAIDQAPSVTVTNSDPIQVDHTSVAMPGTTLPNVSLSLEDQRCWKISIPRVVLEQNLEGTAQLSAPVALNALLDSPPEGRPPEPSVTEMDEITLVDKQ